MSKKILKIPGRSGEELQKTKGAVLQILRTYSHDPNFDKGVI